MAVLVKALNGLAYASVKTRNGLAVGSIKTIRGLDVTAAAGAALLAHTSIGGTQNDATTNPINTTGANLLTVEVSSYAATGGVTLVDTYSNTWTARAFRSGASLTGSQLFYCYAPIVGLGHSFWMTTFNTYAAIHAQAWGGMASSPYDVENWSTIAGSWAALATGSVTPSQANSVLIAHCANDSNGAISIDSGFTQLSLDDVAYFGGNHFGGVVAYKFMPAATAENPTWANAGFSSEATTSITGFKAA